MRWLVALLLGIAVSATAQAASIEARLIRASNEGGKSDEQLNRLEPKLKKIFGYHHYELLGLQKVPLQEDSQVRLDLGEGIVIFVTPRAREKKGRMMDFEMYSGPSGAGEVEHPRRPWRTSCQGPGSGQHGAGGCPHPGRMS